MSLLIDDREEPSLAEHIARFGITAAIARLDFGDIAIQSGDGEVLVGYERKRLTDLIASMQDRRLSGHQFKGMRRVYDRQELIVEGYWRPGENDAVEVPMHGRWEALFHRGSGISYRQVDSYLYSQCECAGVRVWRTGNVSETAHLLVSRYWWWQKDYDLHKSVDALYTNDPTKQKRGAVTVQNGEANLVTLMSAQVQGIDAKAWDIGKHFRSPQTMCNADVSEWRRVEWIDRKGKVKHFGKDVAEGIVHQLRGEKV